MLQNYAMKSVYLSPVVTYAGDISEILSYGSADDIRAALETVADMLAANNLNSIDDIEKLIIEKENADEKQEETEGELRRYKSFFDDIVSHWQDTLADGHWPAAEPDDQTLISAIAEDMQKGSDAITDQQNPGRF